ncbi:MAG: 1,6-anhydro-N-acetylmuramyl-L-alanine amidase AmpD [Gammaproteobacteria bacterium]|nr:1,6-anhydro-N-acetylmuramyl-L-alanine amidase AmpD [Gammaproteobacteria bacterium]
MQQIIPSEFTEGWWSAAERRPSPNHDLRPPHTVDMLVVHAISLPPGEYGSAAISALFCNTLDYGAHPYYSGLQGLKVSAHFLIERDGRLTQYVSVLHRAWHAGVSRFSGQNACNNRSIGVELEGCDDDPFTPAQYLSLGRLTAALFGQFPALSLARIVGHADIAPDRKTDPGPLFDWIGFRAAVAAARR